MRTFKRVSLFIFVSTCLILVSQAAFGWGFWAHKVINREAAALLPEPLKGFYEKNLDYVAEHASDPDLRRDFDKSEGYRHYIDIDRYGSYPNFDVPHSYEDAVKKYGETTVIKNGTVPWTVGLAVDSLAAAMKTGNIPLVLHLSADLGHYVGDMNVPLHVTQNYDGQMTGNIGVHARWESGIPEHFGEKYDFAGIDSVFYIKNPVEHAFEILNHSYSLIDRIFRADSMAKIGIPRDSLYRVEEKDGRKAYIYSERYYDKFNIELDGMVESQMRRATREVASYWYTAWVNAGKPKFW
ncbi:MAG TPA: hypothetical protein VLX91_07535 [Candidatus Acidoferrales bacterium]|nr:hypothetical protein [Candidatus Acidoferrales bacterium]